MMKRSMHAASAFMAVALLASPAMAMKHGGGQSHMGQKGQMANANPAQQKMHETMRKMKQANKPLQEKVLAKKKEMQAIIKAEKFDKDAFLAKNKEIRELKDQMMNAHINAKAELLSNMSAEERASLRLMRKERRGKKNMKKREGMNQSDAKK